MRNTLGAALLSALLAPALAAADERPWIEARSPRFTVVSNGSEGDARALARQFEQIRSVFQVLAPGASQDSDRPFTILGAGDEGTMKRLLPAYWERKGGVRPDGIFVNGPAQVFVALRLDQPASDGVGHSVVFHEYVHFLVERQFDNLPLWLNEGFAEFYATSTVESDRVLVGRAAPWNLQLLQEVALVPLETLLAADASSPLYNEESRATIFYAQSWALVHYLMTADKGAHRPLLQAYLTQIAKGAEPVEAGRQAFGDLKAFGKKLEAYVRGFRFFMLPVPTTGAPPAKSYAVRTLSPAEALAVRASFHAVTGRPEEARAEADEAVRIDPKLSLGWQALSSVHAQENRLDEARRAATEATRTDPQSALAHFTLGVLALGGKDLTAAETALARAVELNDRFAGAQAFLATVRSVLGRPDEQVLPLIRRALHLEPGEPTILIMLSGLLRDRGDFEGARRLGERARRMARSSQERAQVEATLKAMAAVVPSDPTAAARHHELTCEAGTAVSCIEAGNRLETGRGVTKDLTRAVALYGRACDGGDVTGCTNLARMLRYGLGTAKDPVRARALYDKGCTDKIKDACDVLAVMLVRGEGGPADPERGGPLFTASCDGGGGYACMYLGWLHETGKGVVQDLKRGSDLYAKACESGNAEGCRRLGRLHAFGTGVEKDEARAHALFEKACAGGDLNGCGWVGVGLRKARGVARDPERARANLIRACEGGQADFCADLAYMHETGDGTAKDLTRAFALYQKGCNEAGDSFACRAAAIMLSGGSGVARDPAKAAALLTRACDDGDSQACIGLAWRHERGDGIPVDRKRAETLYRKACDQGDPDGCLGIGFLHLASNPAAAKAAFQKACDAKKALGCAQLGLLYVGGQGVPQDFGKAASLFKAGCEGDDAFSCSNLAGLYRAGQGVAQDARKATSLFKKACTGGYQEACSEMGATK